MTSVGPDLLLPGVASKKPAAATTADGPSPSETAAGDGNFAQELDAVTTQSSTGDVAGPDAPTTAAQEKSPPADGTADTPTTPEVASETAVAAPAAPTENVGEISTTPIDLAELQLFGPSQQEVSTAVGTSTVSTVATISDDGQDATAGIVVAPADRDGAAAPIPDDSLLPAVAALVPEPVVLREAAVADSSQLLSPLAALNGSGSPPSLGQASGQTPNMMPPTTANAPQPQGPSPSLLAATLAIDPQGLGGSDAGGDPNANTQSNNKAALRAAASLTSDAKPVETAGGQTFTSALGAAASEAANQTARSAAQAAAQRPARPAQTAPATAQVAVHIVRAVADGASRFNVQLHPAELGRVEVKMEISRDGAVRAMVIADRQETVDQLQRDSRALERALQEAGLKADSQNLQFSLRGGQNGHAMSENRTSIGNNGSDDADVAEVSESSLPVHWSNVAGSTGALDIQV